MYEFRGDRKLHGSATGARANKLSQKTLDAIGHIVAGLIEQQPTQIVDK